MKRIKKGKRLLAVALSMLLAFGGLPTAALAEGQPVQATQGLCEHHLEHTADCGYGEGQPCEHEHLEDCYTNELICGYDEEKETTASDSDAEHTHTQECYALDCPHERREHDADCGYAEAQPCGYTCELCGKTDNEPEPKPGEETETEQAACTLTEGCTLPDGHEGECATEQFPANVGTILVTAFDELDGAVKQVPFNTTWDGLNLPATLGASGYKVSADTNAVPEPGAISIEGVTWEVIVKGDSPAAYEANRPAPCIYWLRAILPEGYELDGGAALPEIEVRYGMALRANGHSLSNGQTLNSIGAQDGDVVTIQSDFTGEVKIPASITDLTLKSNGALADAYITSEAAVSLTIDGLEITAPAGTESNGITGSYPAIELAGDSTLTVKGSNTASGGIESAGIRVSSGQSLTICGDGNLAVSAGRPKGNNPSGAAAIGGNGCYTSGYQKGEVCGVISIEDAVTLRLQGSGLSADLGSGGVVNLVGSITISGKPIITTPGGLYLHAATITIDGGTINATQCQSTSLINSNSDALNRVDIPAGNVGHIQVKKEGDAGYSYTASTQPDGAAYIWLPSEGSYEIRVDRGTHIEAYLVENLAPYATDWNNNISSHLAFTQPNASYSHQLEVSSATLSPTTYNKGTVEVAFNQKPADDTDGSVSVSKDDFATESALTRISAKDNVYTYSYADLPDGTYTVRVKGFKDSSGYENPVHQSATFAVATAAVVIKAVSGVTSPARGATPVTAITETDQYTGTVSWTPNHSTFAADTDYTATITLTPKAGYTLQGVAENFFTVDGATSVTNAANSGEITAVFPKTDKAPIDLKDIKGIAAPVQGNMPVTTITETAQYTGTVTWNPNHSTFAADTDYTATITLTPKAGYTLQGVTENFFTVDGADSVTNAAGSGEIIAVFPKTDKTPIDLKDIKGIAAPVQGNMPVTTITETAQYTGTVTWNPNHSTFAADTDYTATITLTPKAGYTLQGVTENFFTVDGADSVTNAAGSGEIIAVFPKTDKTPIDLKDIKGIVAPVRGNTPVTAITETEQYTGTVSWNPNHSIFAADTDYTATITLTPEPGYTLQGVTENFFTVAGASPVTNTAGSGEIIAVFPKTDKTPIDLKTIEGIAAPVRGNTPVTAITETKQYTGTVSWNPNHSIFAADTDYTATITLTPKAGYTMQGVAENFFTVDGAASVTNAADSGEITAVFPKTEKQVYTVTVEHNGNGTASANPASTVEEETVTLSATADSGYHFKEWQVISGGISITNNQFTMPAGNVTVKAIFEKNSGGSGSGSSSSSSSNSTATAPKDSYAGTGNQINQSISRSDLQRLTDAGKRLTIQSGTVGIILTPAALKAILAVVPVTAGSITVAAVPADISAFPNAAALIGTRPAYSFTISYKDSKGSAIPVNVNFPTGSASISLNYAPAEGEVAGSLFMVYVDGKGAVTWLDKSSYTGAKVLADVPHFSVYGVAYKAPVPVFTDIANHWAKADIEFVAARGLLSGTGNNLFSPDAAMTRGMFVTSLGRLAGVNPDSYKTRSFTDVKADAYYAAYVEWAAQKNIVKGTGEGLFSPDAPVTREQMAVMMTNYAGQMGYSIPTPLAAVTFADNESISTWAAKEVAAMQRAGIIKGKDGNRFDPQASATRAEVSAVLRRFVEIVIDPVTAQSWVKNDSGQWLYYKDGKALTGWKQLGGKWYYFDKNGIMAVNTKVDGYEIGPDGARKENH